MSVFENYFGLRPVEIDYAFELCKRALSTVLLDDKVKNLEDYLRKEGLSLIQFCPVDDVTGYLIQAMFEETNDMLMDQYPFLNTSTRVDGLNSRFEIKDADRVLRLASLMDRDLFRRVTKANLEECFEIDEEKLPELLNMPEELEGLIKLAMSSEQLEINWAGSEEDYNRFFAGDVPLGGQVMCRFKDGSILCTGYLNKIPVPLFEAIAKGTVAYGCLHSTNGACSLTFREMIHLLKIQSVVSETYLQQHSEDLLSFLEDCGEVEKADLRMEEMECVGVRLQFKKENLVSFD